MSVSPADAFTQTARATTAPNVAPAPLAICAVMLTHPQVSLLLKPLLVVVVSTLWSCHCWPRGFRVGDSVDGANLPGTTFGDLLRRQRPAGEALGDKHGTWLRGGVDRSSRVVVEEDR